MHLCKVYRWENRLHRAAAHGAVDRLNPSSVHVLSPELVADLTLLGLHCAFCLGRHSWPCEAPRCHLSLPEQFSRQGWAALAAQAVWADALVESNRSRCRATAGVGGGNRVAPNFPLPGRGLGPGHIWELLGKGCGGRLGQGSGGQEGAGMKGGKHVGKSLAEQGLP